MDLPNRQHPAHQPVYDYGNRSNILFVTVCTQKRKPILANQEAHRILVKAWQTANHWVVGRYIIMPDHIHLFCAPARLDHLSVKRWIAFWKSNSTKSWLNPGDKPLWQIDGWDTQLRKGDSYTAKWSYVRNNPIRHGLVESAEQWPYQGELHTLIWHD